MGLVPPTAVLFAALAIIYAVAFLVRLFSVLRFESVIHEFDPYFNYRTTGYLVERGWYDFYNWFDDMVWYPLGRIVGGTIYPGLMITSAISYWTLHFFNFAIELRNVCVFLAPFFASNTAIITYFMGKECKDSAAGLVAAAFVAIVPAYISRSVAGSYDNEGVAIFALVLTFYFFVRAVNRGSLLSCFFSVLSYYYMANAWGGYIFIINLIPLYVAVMLITGRWSPRLYLTYSTFYIVGTMLCMQVHFVGFQAVQSGEHMLAALVFLGLQIYSFVFKFVRPSMDDVEFERLLRVGLVTVLGGGAAVFVIGMATGYISPWTGRFWTLLDPTYAKENIPIIASVSEHQPTTWSSFFFDLHILAFLFPAGLYFGIREAKKGNDAMVFLIMYGMTSVYFAGVMVRLMLVLAPAMCLIAAIGASTLLTSWCKIVQLKEKPKGKTDKTQDAVSVKYVSYVMVFAMFIALLFYGNHCTWVTSEAYSSPSIVLAARGNNGQKIIFDDFREAYFWLRQNTPEDAKVMSWWDYGYQITAMANRTVLVDNNTWNNTHIATVGKAMASDEETAYHIMKKLDVDYILVIFGGMTGYSSDDINKFLWMVRIGGTLDPSIKEMDYHSESKEFRIDSQASKTMLNSMMYSMCYYRFGEMQTEYGKPSGYDRVRNAEIGAKEISFNRIEEAFTSEHWIVRIYKVKPLPNRAEK